MHNTGPIGCLPYNIIHYQPKAHNLDQYGCVEPQNKVAREFNRQLKQRVDQLKARLHGTAFTYVDIYSAKYSLIRNSKILGNLACLWTILCSQKIEKDTLVNCGHIFVDAGFENPSTFCCGSYCGYHIECGKKAIVNGKVYGNPCPNPTRRISWDGIHYSEAANLLVSKLILNGSLSYPPSVSIQEACHGSWKSLFWHFSSFSNKKLFCSCTSHQQLTNENGKRNPTN